MTTYPRPLSEQPPTADADGANLDPRHCDCGKGQFCPLITKAWRDYLGPAMLASMDRWGGSWDNVATFAVVDLEDGTIFDSAADGVRFRTREKAEAFARLRNYGRYVAAQSYRVVRLEPVLFADVKPRGDE